MLPTKKILSLSIIYKELRPSVAALPFLNVPFSSSFFVESTLKTDCYIFVKISNPSAAKSMFRVAFFQNLRYYIFCQNILLYHPITYRTGNFNIYTLIISRWALNLNNLLLLRSRRNFHILKFRRVQTRRVLPTAKENQKQ